MKDYTYIYGLGKKRALTDGKILYILDPNDVVEGKVSGVITDHQLIYRTDIIFTIEKNQLKIIKNIFYNDFPETLRRISNFLNKIKKEEEEEKKSKETYIVTCYFEDEEQKYKYCDNLKEVEEYVLELLHDGEILDNISIFRGNFCEFNFKVEVSDGKM